jgi:hypothetical protein
VRSDQLKIRLLKAANEFLKKAGECEASLVVVAPTRQLGAPRQPVVARGDRQPDLLPRGFVNQLATSSNE